MIYTREALSVANNTESVLYMTPMFRLFSPSVLSIFFSISLRRRFERFSRYFQRIAVPASVTGAMSAVMSVIQMFSMFRYKIGRALPSPRDVMYESFSENKGNTHRASVPRKVIEVIE